MELNDRTGTCLTQLFNIKVGDGFKHDMVTYVKVGHPLFIVDAHNFGMNVWDGKIVGFIKTKMVLPVKLQVTSTL